MVIYFSIKFYIDSLVIAAAAVCDRDKNRLNCSRIHIIMKIKDLSYLKNIKKTRNR